MDKEKNGIGTEAAKRRTLRSRIAESITAELEKRKKSKEQVLIDLAFLLTALLLARCHVVFGAHPLAIGFIAVLPTRVWIAAAGAAIGSLTLGGAGVIYAMISVITVFLRIIISTTPRGEGGESRAFSESLLLRMSVAVIGGFICALYEVLLSGITLQGVLFGGAMILISPLVTFGLSGLVGSEVDLKELFRGSEAVFSTRGRTEHEKYSIVFFQCSALLLLFLLGLSLGPFELFGISAAYILGGIITLLAARRLGALRGAAVGFITMLGLSSAYSVAFALLGLVSGVLFRVGISYAIVGGGAALVAWCAYAGGLTGFVTVLPEYLISAVTVSPIIGRLHTEKTEQETKSARDEAAEMAGTVALAYKNKYSGALDSLESALAGLGRTVDSYTRQMRAPTEDDLYELIVECIDKYCATCQEQVKEGCDSEGILNEREIEKLSSILYKKGRLDPEDLNTDPAFCKTPASLIETINRAVGIYSEQIYLESRGAGLAEQMEAIASLLSEARHRDEEEKSFNSALTATVKEAARDSSLSDFSVKVLGKRVPHIIISAEDESGERISSPQLISRIEGATGLRLGRADFYRRERMAVMECSAARRFTVECAYATAAGERESVCGDSVRSLPTPDGFHHIILSDGMGSGSEARHAADLVCDLLDCSLHFGLGGERLLSLTNRVLMSGGRECSASVDLCSVDLYSGECTFLKCGAATSYVKRDGSIFRISSRTAPLGLMKKPDGERIRTDVKDGDTVILLSDGITGGAEDAPWLLELLSRPSKLPPREYADRILAAARTHSRSDDDMTVAVAKICAAE